MNKKSVFIIGSKGIPAKYGGFETFVDNLVSRQSDMNIQYFVACRRDLSSNKQDMYEYSGARCFNVDVPNIGPAKAIIYDVRALAWATRYIQKYDVKDAIVYILACRMGPFVDHYKRKLKKYGTKVFVNPDGHEWLRDKWSYPVKRYWKYSERLMVKHADLLICDSQHIELYIRDTYKRYKPNTIYLSYGSTISRGASDSLELQKWYKTHEIKPNQYYLIVGRFVPENNYKTMLAEFSKSKTHRRLAIITGVDNLKFLNQLKNETHFDKDERIRFVGTVYDKKLLSQIREHAFAYIHGHEVGGTNPSLLEALGTTQLNLLLDVGFNREVGQEGAIYWTKECGSLSQEINMAEKMSKREIDAYATKSKSVIAKKFNWNKIVEQYESVFDDHRN
jgi:rhamnosyltransferase